MSPRLSAGLLTGILLAACQSAPPRPPAAELAVRSHNQATAALARDDFEHAASGFRDAMRQATLLDDWQGEASSRLALAMTLRRQGQPAPATQTLRPLLSDMTLPYGNAQRRRAALLQAQWQLAEGAWDSLPASLALAANWCGDCRDSTLSRLRAQLALHQGELDTAWREAGEALRQAASDDERAEALRAQANVAIAGPAAGRLIQGRAAATAALDIDKRLGNSVGIFQDLLLRAWTAHLAADSDAATWLRRACEVAQASAQPALRQQLKQLPEEIWHVTPQANGAAGTVSPAAAPGPGDCRQP